MSDFEKFKEERRLKNKELKLKLRNGYRPKLYKDDKKEIVTFENGEKYIIRPDGFRKLNDN